MAGFPRRSGDLSVELVQAIQRGDGGAWSELYSRYRDELLFSIRCRLGTGLRAHVQSEDILQSVVKDALGDLARFEHRGAGSLGHYLHVCVLNKIRNKAEYFGAAGRARERALSDSVFALVPAVDGDGLQYRDQERFPRLERGVASLPEEMREVLILRAVEGLSNQEAAAAVGKSAEATSKLYNRALARLSSLAETDRER
jgi:RNA polymerase sigma-70 factor (ECF subfamily)